MTLTNSTADGLHTGFDLVDEPPRRRCARHETRYLHALKPLRLEFAWALDVIGARTLRRRKIGEVLGVRGRLPADHDHHFDLLREFFRFGLTVMRVGADRVDRANLIVFRTEFANDLGKADHVDCTTTPTRLARGSASMSSGD